MKAGENVGERSGWRERRDRDRGHERMLVIARRKVSHRALVIRGGTRVVDLFVEARDRGKNQREENRGDASRRDQGAGSRSFSVGQPKAHVRGSVRSQGARRKHLLVQPPRQRHPRGLPMAL
jgi:hypothetical protein